MEHIQFGFLLLIVGTAIVSGHVEITTATDNGRMSVEEHTDVTLVCTAHDTPGLSWKHNDHNVTDHEQYHHSDDGHDHSEHAHGEHEHHDDEHHHDAEHEHDDHDDHDDHDHGTDEHQHVQVVTKSTGVQMWESTLTIHGAELHDAGVYTCICALGSKETVNITVTPAHVPVKIASDRLEVANGSKLEIVCEADIHTRVTWFFNGSPVRTSPELVITETVDKASHVRRSVLSRPVIAAAHRGVYVCRNSHHDHDQDSVTVSIQGMANKSSVSHVTNLWTALAVLAVASNVRV